MSARSLRATQISLIYLPYLRLRQLTLRAQGKLTAGTEPRPSATTSISTIPPHFSSGETHSHLYHVKSTSVYAL